MFGSDRNNPETFQQIQQRIDDLDIYSNSAMLSGLDADDFRYNVGQYSLQFNTGTILDVSKYESDTLVNAVHSIIEEQEEEKRQQQQ